MTGTNSDITLVITCFNYGEYLADAVGSALTQVGGPPHVTVVDDGSTDPATLAALERLPAGVGLIRQANAGPSYARNAGLRAATTPFLIVLDADDLLSPTALQDLRGPFERNSKIGFSYGVTRFFGDWEGELVFPPYDPYRLIYRHIIGSTALMRRELFERVGGYDPKFTGYEDWDFWVSALSCGWRGEKVEKVTLFYRRHGTSTVQGRARPQYRRWFRTLRHKHAHLYARDGRRQLARESALSPFGRFVYRWWWGARPMPARMEWALHSLLWRPRSGSSSEPRTSAVRLP
jgi:glycosyltransferase involved in cell wall biosynthesis